MKRFNIYIILFTVVLSGCFVDSLKPKELTDYKDKIVVNGVLSNASGISIQVTNSKAAFDSEFPKLVKDAEVKLFQNQIEIPLTYDLFSEQYTAPNTITSGAAVTLEIKHPDYSNVTSIFRMPDKINATSTLIEDGGIDTSGYVSDLVEVSFNDPGGSQNYYIINFFYRNETLNQYIPISFPSTDPSLAEYNSYKLNNAAILFTDELFNGRTKKISMVPVSGLVAGNTGDKYMVQLSSITEDLYKYYKSLQRAEDAKEISFDAGYNNAVVIHSNIRHGLGILGGADVNQMILK
jgi:hypothetical protein